MDSPVGQVRGATAASAPTREQLMAAAAELIAELGWGRVTTRAVAERAGLPHGAVSYHFRGKQELLTEAAMYAFAAGDPGRTSSRRWPASRTSSGSSRPRSPTATRSTRCSRG